MLPQTPVLDPEQALENQYWRKRLRVEQRRVYNRPLEEEVQENIRAYWQSIFEVREDWDNGQSEESSQ